jgi:hypothetical protein
MKENIPHDQLLVLLNYDPTTGIFTQRINWWGRKAGDVPGGKTPQGYWYIGVGGKQYPAHRLAWFYVHKEWPTGDIDHINRNRLDNRLANLRHVSRSKNLLNINVRAGSLSGVTGVSPSGEKTKPWKASIQVDGKQTWLGNHATVESAIAARKEAELKLTA